MGVIAGQSYLHLCLTGVFPGQGDLDGSEAAETVAFGLDGTSCEIALSQGTGDWGPYSSVVLTAGLLSGPARLYSKAPAVPPVRPNVR